MDITSLAQWHVTGLLSLDEKSLLELQLPPDFKTKTPEIHTILELYRILSSFSQTIKKHVSGSI